MSICCAGSIETKCCEVKESAAGHDWWFNTSADQSRKGVSCVVLLFGIQSLIWR